MARRVALVVNAAAGKGCTPEEREATAQVLRDAGLEVDLLEARNGADLTSTAKEAVRDGYETIVAAGGDGTVNAIASALAGTSAALGVLPMGTLNHFAKAIGLPLARAEAARTIVEGRRARVDVGEVNGQVFVNNSSIGLYPNFVMKRRRHPSRMRWGGFAWALSTVLSRHSVLDVRLTLDEVTQSRRTPLVFVGNNKYNIEGFELGTRERLDESCLSIYLTQRHGRWPLLGIAFRALFGQLHQLDDFEALAAHRVTVETRHQRMAVAVDGEVKIMEMPLEYRSWPGALEVLVPN